MPQQDLDTTKKPKPSPLLSELDIKLLDMIDPKLTEVVKALIKSDGLVSTVHPITIMVHEIVNTVEEKEQSATSAVDLDTLMSHIKGLIQERISKGHKDIAVLSYAGKTGPSDINAIFFPQEHVVDRASLFGSSPSLLRTLTWLIRSNLLLDFIEKIGIEDFIKELEK